jgi:hypothetical protein
MLSAEATTAHPRRPRRPEARGGHMADKQIEFPPLQTHVKSFEVAMIVISIICAIVVLVIMLFTGIGNEFRPTV